VHPKNPASKLDVDNSQLAVKLAVELLQAKPKELYLEMNSKRESHLNIKRTTSAAKR